MALIDALRAGVAVANTMTKQGGLQVSLPYEHCNGQDAYGPTYDPPVNLLVIYDQRQQQVRTKSGELAASRGQITVLDIKAVIAATGGDGRIRDVDLFTLPDGSKAAILAVGGFIDAGTRAPVATDVWLG